MYTFSRSRPTQGNRTGPPAYHHLAITMSRSNNSPVFPSFFKVRLPSHQSPSSINQQVLPPLYLPHSFAHQHHRSPHSPPSTRLAKAASTANPHARLLRPGSPQPFFQNPTHCGRNMREVLEVLLWMGSEDELMGSGARQLRWGEALGSLAEL